MDISIKNTNTQKSLIYDEKEENIILQKKPSFKNKLNIAKQDAKFYKTDIEIYERTCQKIKNELENNLL
jgi:hypothetical protein